MIPILFPTDALEFTSRGLGALSDAISCNVIEERNGEYELTLVYPKHGIHFADLEIGRIICAIPSPYRLPQPFRIYKITRSMRDSVTVNAQHISYDLSGVTVKPFQSSSVADTLNKIKINSLNTNNFKFSGSSSLAVSHKYDYPYTARQLLGGVEGSILDLFGGEYEFDGFNVKWYAQRGQNSGVTIRYGKNLLDVVQDIDSASLVSGVCPYWQDSETGNVVYGGIVRLDGEFVTERIVPLDMTEYFETAPTVAQLEAQAKTYITANYATEPELSCDVSFALIEQSEQYKEFALLEKCDLCDTVNVYYGGLGVNSTAKIVKIDTDVLRNKYNSVTVGTVRANIAQTIEAQQKALQDIPTVGNVAAIVQGALGNITGATGGSVRFLDTDGDGDPDTLYIADNPDPVKAKRVWRFNYLGWAASKNGYDGPFEMGATLEDGLLANFVTAAHLTAGTIESADGESFFVDLDNGIVRIKANQEITDELEALNERITETSTEIINNAQEIILTALESYVTTQDYDEFVQSIQTTLSVMAGQIELSFATSERIEDIEGQVQEFINEQIKYIRFINGNIIIGVEGNELILTIQNDRLYFSQNGNEVAYFANDKLYVQDAEFINSVVIGKFAFQPAENGSLSFRRVD